MLNPFNYTKANNKPKTFNENKEKQIPYKEWITGCKHNENLGREIKRNVTAKLLTAIHPDNNMKITFWSTNLHSQRVYIFLCNTDFNHRQNPTVPESTKFHM